MLFLETYKNPLTPEEEKVLLERWSRKDKEAKNLLIEHNLRLVAHIVKKYSQNENDMEELISIGTIGLIKAINTFRQEKGSKLATYSSRCIENELLMHFRSEKKHSREISLNEPIGSDKEGNVINLIDIIEVENEDVIEQWELDDNTKWIYENIRNVLTERELVIIKKRYGLYGTGEIPQRELARELGISRSYVSRIEKKALGKLREAFLRTHRDIDKT